MGSPIKQLHLDQLVETKSGNDKDFSGSWCEGVLVEFQGRAGVLVEYLEFIEDEDGQPLRETVPLERLRPAPPTELARFASMQEVKMGHSVEAYHDDCWWQGVVVMVATAGVKVNLCESDGSNIFVRDPRLLRPRVDLREGAWRRAVPNRADLLALGLPPADANAAVTAMMRVPAVPGGSPRMRSGATAALDPPPIPSQSDQPLSHRLAAHSRRTAATRRTGDLQPLPMHGLSDPAVGDTAASARHNDGARKGAPGAGALPPRAAMEVVEEEGDETDREDEAGEEGEEEEEDGKEGSDGGSGDAGYGGRRQRVAPGDAPPRAGAKRRRGQEADESGDDDEAKDEDDAEEEEEEDGEEEEEEEVANGRRAAKQTGARRSAAADNDDDGKPPRPRRQNKNCVVYVNGFPVLKANMYGMVSKTTQALQLALKAGTAGGVGRVTQEPKSRRRKSPHKGTAWPKPLQPRAQTAECTQRLEHNSAIRRDAQACEATRARYMLQHLDRLRPFITPQAEAHIRKAAESRAQDIPPQQPVTQQPEQVLASLREYQLEGLAWLVAQYDRGVNAILADEMGLGKTLQTITFLAHLKFVRHVEGPHLVVVPLSVLSSWMSEFKKWCPSMRVVRLHSTDDQERHHLIKEVLSRPSSFDVAVTTYEMVNSKHFGHSLKHTLTWRYLVLDEGHKVKNEETRVSDGMRHISRQQVLMLTGTPVQNNLHELFALLSFMYPDVFTDPTRFDEAFNLRDRKVDRQQLEAAHYLLRPFMLRRLKGEVEVRLPPKEETRIHCPLAPMQTFWYRRLLMRDSSLLKDMEARDQGAAKLAGRAGEEGSNSWKAAMNLLMQLRKVCNHPFMFPDAEPDFDGESAPEELVTGSGKMMVLDRLLAKLKERGHRVVLFSQFNIMLDVIEDYLTVRGYKYRRLDGSTNRIQRMIDIEQFNKPNSDIFIYILCTRAGGLGVNLQTADTCILFDSDWNPQWDLQAMARVHRIGQTRPVHVYRLVTEGTAEERVQRRAETKLYLDQMVNRGSTSTAEQLEGLHLSEVLSMLKFGADRIFRNEAGDMPSEEELNRIMDRSRLVAQMEAAAAAAASGREGAAAASGAVLGDETAVTGSAFEGRRGAEEPAGCSGAREDEGGGATGGREEAVGGGGVRAGKRTASDGGGGAAVAAAAATGGGGGRGAAGGGAAGGGVLLESKHSALDFNAEAPPVDTFLFMGQDFRALRGTSIRDIASQYWADKKRQRRERLVDVGGFKVLRENNYTMEEGFVRSAADKSEKSAAGRKQQRAGIDYGHTDFCLICWDGGNLLCCDHCPAAFHAGCLGYDAATVATLEKRRWSCPHHACDKCWRKTAQAGGLLFRCEMCERAFCEDDLPADYSMVGECELFKALGQHHPRGACYIHCSQRCRELSQELSDVVKDAIAAAEAQGPPGAQKGRTGAVQPGAARRAPGGGGGGGVRKPAGPPKTHTRVKDQPMAKKDRSWAKKAKTAR